MPEWTEEARKGIQSELEKWLCQTYIVPHTHPVSDPATWVPLLTNLVEAQVKRVYAAALGEIESQAIELRGTANIVDTYLRPDQRAAPLHDKAFIALGAGAPKSEQRIKELEDRLRECLLSQPHEDHDRPCLCRWCKARKALSSEGKGE